MSNIECLSCSPNLFLIHFWCTLYARLEYLDTGLQIDLLFTLTERWKFDKFKFTCAILHQTTTTTVTGKRREFPYSWIIPSLLVRSTSLWRNRSSSPYRTGMKSVDNPSSIQYSVKVPRPIQLKKDHLGQVPNSHPLVYSVYWRNYIYETRVCLEMFNCLQA